MRVYVYVAACKVTLQKMQQRGCNVRRTRIEIEYRSSQGQTAAALQVLQGALYHMCICMYVYVCV